MMESGTALMERTRGLGTAPSPLCPLPLLVPCPAFLCPRRLYRLPWPVPPLRRPAAPWTSRAAAASAPRGAGAATSRRTAPTAATSAAAAGPARRTSRPAPAARTAWPLRSCATASRTAPTARTRTPAPARGCQPQEAPTGQELPAQNTPAQMASASISSWCATGSPTVNWRGRQGPPRKSRAVEPGALGAHGSHAARRVGLGFRAGAATAPLPVSRCCSTALAPSTRLRPASLPPAQWMVNGPPGLPGPHARSHAGAPRPGSGGATHPRTGAGPAPYCPGTLTALTRPGPALRMAAPMSLAPGNWCSILVPPAL